MNTRHWLRASKVATIVTVAGLVAVTFLGSPASAESTQSGAPQNAVVSQVFNAVTQDPPVRTNTLCTLGGKGPYLANLDGAGGCSRASMPRCSATGPFPQMVSAPLS
jgi:hypothetical protein